jgi:peptide-methionine (R)-S-oxide reductase
MKKHADKKSCFHPVFAISTPKFLETVMGIILALSASLTIATVVFGVPLPQDDNPQTANPAAANQNQGAQVGEVKKTEQAWRQQLTDLEYYVTREKGTERAFTGKLWNEKRPGTYTCKCCGQPLFDSKTKFESGTGWPSYYQPIKPDAVNNVADFSAGMVRTEVTCSRCDAHLGHVFDDGPRPTGLRYCMNSVSLSFVPAKKVVYGYETPEKLVEALKVAAAGHSKAKVIRCLCWDRLPSSIKKQMESSNETFMPRKVQSMTIRPASPSDTVSDDFEYNVKFIGDIEVSFEDGSQPVKWPYGEFEGRYYLATALQKGTLEKIKDGTIETEPELPKFQSLSGSGSR